MGLPRVGIIGAGSLSTRRIYPYIGVAGARLAAVCDLERAKAEANAARWGGSVYTDWREMVESEALDGVIVCIGAEAHADLAIEIMRAGLPVYTEKPPAPSAERAWEVAAVAEESGLLCMTAFKKRYARCYRRAKQFIDSGEIGRRRLIAMHYCSGQYANDGSPRGTFLFDFCIHAIDLVRFLFGDVSQVRAIAQGMDAYAVSLGFPDGSVGTLSLCDGRTWQAPAEQVHLTGAGSWMDIRNSSSYTIWLGGEVTEAQEPPLATSAGDSGIETGHLTEIEAFVKALAGDPSEVVSPIAESARSMELLEAIERAAETGRAVGLQAP